MCTSVSLVYIGATVYCWIDLVAAIGGVTVAVLTYVVRAWRIFFFYRLQERKVAASTLYGGQRDLANGDMTSAASTGSHAADKLPTAMLVFRSERSFVLAAATLSVLAVVVQYAMFFANGKFDGIYSPHTAETCPELEGSTFVMLAVIGTLANSLNDAACV